MHQLSVVLCQLVLSVILLYSGATKVRDRDVARFVRIVRLLVPARIAPATARLIGVVELALGLSLLVTSGRWLSAAFAGAAVFMAAMAVVAVRLLRLPTPPPCHCFGASEAPVSRLDLARNVVLSSSAAISSVASSTIERDVAAMVALALPAVAVALLLAHVAEVRTLLDS
ncbi:MAG: MauE/DoxX family redox-associated membrane protein [Phycicoccus sp.]